MTTLSIVHKACNFCHTLRDDGMGHGNYLGATHHLKQLTTL